MHLLLYQRTFWFRYEQYGELEDTACVYRLEEWNDILTYFYVWGIYLLDGDAVRSPQVYTNQCSVIID